MEKCEACGVDITGRRMGICKETGALVHYFCPDCYRKIMKMVRNEAGAGDIIKYNELFQNAPTATKSFLESDMEIQSQDAESESESKEKSQSDNEIVSQTSSSKTNIGKQDIIVQQKLRQMMNEGPKMTLISCPACGKQISPQAYSCPNCGHPMRKQPQQTIVQERVIQPSTSKAQTTSNGGGGIGFWGIVFAIIVALLIISFG